MYKNLAFLIVFMVAGGIGIHFNQPIVFVPSAVLAVVFFVRQLRVTQAVEAVGRNEIKTTDAQLRTDLIAVQKLAMSKLSAADDATQTKVAELLADAGKHLGDPYTNSRVVYGSDYFVNWNKEGIALVAQAKKLIDDFVAGQPKA
jgi:hypothetical protein